MNFTNGMTQDFDGTLAAVRQIGYKEVEFVGYSGKSPQEARAALDKNDQTSPSAHSPLEALGKNLSATIDAAHVIGQIFVVCPYVDAGMRNADGWKRIAETFNRTGEATQKTGIPQPGTGNSWFA